MRKIVLHIVNLSIILVFLCSCELSPDSSTSLPKDNKPTNPISFIDSGQNLGKGNGGCVTSGDIEGDGDIDILISNKDTKSVLLINDGLGAFTQSKLDFGPSTCVALADVNDDNLLDIFFTQDKKNEVWLNHGNAAFLPSDQSLVSPESTSVALGDLDGDGDLDAFVTNWHFHPNQVFLNDGDGVFTDSGQKLGAMFGNDVALGDVDQDGDLDALVANNGESTANSAVLWLNDGMGVFKDSTQRLGYSNAYSVALGDLDGDGDLDAYIANSSHNGADPADQVWMNDGNGVFSDSGQKLGDQYSLTVDLADIEGDGDLDVITGNWKSSIRIWLNNGKGIFLDSEVVSESISNAGLEIIDVDLDGDMDIAVSANTWDGGDGFGKLWKNQQNP